MIASTTVDSSTSRPIADDSATNAPTNNNSSTNADATSTSDHRGTGQNQTPGVIENRGTTSTSASASNSSHIHQVPSQAEDSEEKKTFPGNPNVTCKFWVDGECSGEDGFCINESAHRLFPVIVERASKKGYKNEPYRHFHGEDPAGCWWPANVCGYSHSDHIGGRKAADAISEKADEEAAIRLHYQALARERPYKVELVFTCNTCNERFFDQDEVIKPCKLPQRCAKNTSSKETFEDGMERRWRDLGISRGIGGGLPGFPNVTDWLRMPRHTRLFYKCLGHVIGDLDCY
jgi:hypothetical protein